MDLSRALRRSAAKHDERWHKMMYNQKFASLLGRT
jgi:hypothetical protein